LQSTQQSLPLWAMYAQALGLPLFALALTFFGIRNARDQTRVSKEKLRHDLYDRRFAIYWAFVNMISSYLEGKDGDAIFRAWDQAVVAFQQSSFILNSEMKQYLLNLKDTVFRMYTEEGRHRGKKDIPADMFGQLEVEKIQNLGTLFEILPVLTEKFEPFLKLDDLSKRGQQNLCSQKIKSFWCSFFQKAAAFLDWKNGGRDRD
ncbi:hypothetical protein, partial [Acidocella sp.]|uniref:hypothetical protein n=1 Tax=Acidocella sp. TaxID=50710 RepID=UPI002614F170